MFKFIFIIDDGVDDKIVLMLQYLLQQPLEGLMQNYCNYLILYKKLQ